MKKPPATGQKLFEAHQRSFGTNRYVYPVLSRRSAGISIGVNLNPDKLCNFNCIYCQVDRAEPSEGGAVELGRLADELRAMIDLVVSGRIYRQTKFRDVPDPLRRLVDVAISGDGEPTLCANFDEVVSTCADVLRRHRLADVKLVLITNASMFHRERVRRGLDVLDEANGEIWAKLDAGTEAYYRQLARTAVPLEQILDNLSRAARARPIVIQSLWVRIDGEPAPTAEQDAYCRRLGEILAAGGRIKLVQIHTLARLPAESRVTALSRAQVDALAERVRQQTGLAVAAFYKNCESCPPQV